MAQTSYTPAQISNPVTVVSPNFLTPYPVDLIIVRKLLSLFDGNFAITDVNGNIVFKVKGEPLSFHERRVLLDAACNPIISFQMKLMSMHNRWVVLRGNSSDSKDLIFTAKQPNMIQMRISLHVFLANNESNEHVYDFKVKGKWLDRACTIHAGDDTIIAQMHKKYTLESVALGKDTFCVTVYPNIDYAFIVALVVILHEVNHDNISL